MNKTTIALAALTALAIAAPAAAQTYDAFGGFNGSTNQTANGVNNGNFIYGTADRSTPGVSGTFFAVNSNCVIPGSTCLQSTATGGNASLPGVYKGGSSFGTVTVPTDRLLIHPGDNSLLTFIAFVAPTAGTYNLAASFRTQDSSPTGIDIFQIGTTGGGLPLTFNQLATNTTSPFARSLSVTLGAGEAIGFGIGNGGTFFNDSTGVSFTAAAVPEPASWALMIMGFGAVGFAMRRRPRTAVTFA